MAQASEGYRKEREIFEEDKQKRPGTTGSSNSDDRIVQIFLLRLVGVRKSFPSLQGQLRLKDLQSWSISSSGLSNTEECLLAVPGENAKIRRLLDIAKN